ncbi:ABC transporter permease [Siphonobacter aquaeclarae]|uniref:Putative ABC transport system permease protein n=1 Tax=Siphonobacter aquaeclarae TaxID=563176 RepID=A0A1G9HVV3_9BACT|nr:ABC transporter permease [Siphonobacter aquaeclarae]SDL16703.1 putative ABC transport system permease protein [Siphonobacter aquaeclarae]
MMPPSLLTRLIGWLCAPDLREEVLGDLHERFVLRARREGEARARRRYWRDVMSFMRPSVLGRPRLRMPDPAMFRNYFLIARRNLLRQKTLAAINISGLAVGLASCLLIVLFVLHEESYDRYHANADRLFRMTTEGSIAGKEIRIATAGTQAGPALVRDYAGVEATVRLYREGTFHVRKDHQVFKEERVVFPDSNFFQVFSIPLLKGDPKTVLVRPNTLVLTETMARKYFGEQDPVGKTLTMGTRGLFEVTGVCADVPLNTHFHYDMFGSISSVKMRDKWLASGAFTYVLLRKGYSVDRLRAEMPGLVRKYVGPEIQEFLSMSLHDFEKKGDRITFGFQPVTAIHLHADFEEDTEAQGDARYVYLFSGIALFILAVACINFMNLSTAASTERAREVGIRKVLGSFRSQLMAQFLSESLVVTFLALFIAVDLVVLALPAFNELTGKQFTVGVLTEGWMPAGILTGTLLIGLAAGSYPAFFLSSFRPAGVLKAAAATGKGNRGFRNVLVTIQFVVSVSMIAGTIVVYRQLQYIQNKKIGFDKEQVLVLHDTYALGDKRESFRQEVSRLSGVEYVTAGGYMPAGLSNNGTDGFRAEDEEQRQSVPYRMKTYTVDEDYLPTLGIQLLAGQNFKTRGNPDGILVNEAAVREFGWKNAVGKRIRTVGDGTPESRRLLTVVGVIRDFHFEDMHHSIRPLVLLFGQDNYQMAVRVRSNDLTALLKQIEAGWKRRTDSPFGYSFLNQRFNALYVSEQHAGRLMGVFAVLAVCISCLGLFGLAMFTVQQRRKEIGIRKVLGASVAGVVALLSKEFLKLVGIAILIASPLAWYGTNRWLEAFAYRVSVDWWVLALAGLLAVVIALITISFQSVRAALSNPVQSLRSE